MAPWLNEVPVDSLLPFPNRTGTQAFEPNLLVSHLKGGSNAKEALYVKPVTLEQAVGIGGTALGSPKLLDTEHSELTRALLYQ